MTMNITQAQTRNIIFQMRHLFLVMMIAITLVRVSSFLVSPLDPRIMDRVNSSKILSSKQKQIINMFVEKVKTTVERRKPQIEDEKKPRVYHYHYH